MYREVWEAKIFSKIKVKNDCWIWTGLTQQGYGFAVFNHKRVCLHRLFFKNYFNYLPKKKVLDHICEVRNCVNPFHLQPLTHKENILKGKGAGAINARKTHCVHGHELTKENCYSEPKQNFRRCRKCMYRRTRQWLKNAK